MSLLRVAGQTWAELDQSDLGRQLRQLMVGEVPVRAEGIVGALGAWPPCAALWELGPGKGLRPSLELLGRLGPATAPVAVVQLARASFTQGNEAGAEKLLRQALARRPNDVGLLNTLGTLLQQQQRWGEAIEWYRSARAADPRLGVALALALGTVRRRDEAEAILRDLLRREPENPEIHRNLGNALHDQQRLEEAAAAYCKAIELKPDYAYAYDGFGNALRGQKKLDAAVAAHRKAIVLKPDCAMAYSNLGAALHDQQKLDAAEAAFRKAIELKPDFAEAYSTAQEALMIPQTTLIASRPTAI